MPNGGADNCGTCPYGLRQGLSEGGRSKTFCKIRNLEIQDAFWTYCVNWWTRSENPDGPVFASGIYEGGYCRIPWNGRNAPISYKEDGKCIVCQKNYHKGIEVLHNDKNLQFCCNNHYLKWWKECNQGETLTLDYEYDEPDITENSTNLHAIYTELYNKQKVFDFIHYGRDPILDYVEGIDYQEKFAGCLLGLAVGDALGNPVNGTTPGTYGLIEDYVPLSRRKGPRGRTSVATHFVSGLAHSLILNNGLNPKNLADDFVRLRIRGMGQATLKFVRKYRAQKVHWYEAGIKSAGNGAAMRVAPIGLYYNNDFENLKLASGIQAMITHNDRTAIASSIVMALAVAILTHLSPEQDLKQIDDIKSFCHLITDSVEGIDEPLMTRNTHQNKTTLCNRIKNELPVMITKEPIEVNNIWLSGTFVLESLPFALYCFLRSPSDFKQTLLTAVNYSCNSDIVACMACALSGAFNGSSTIPNYLLKELEGKKTLVDLADHLLYPIFKGVVT